MVAEQKSRVENHNVTRTVRETRSKQVPVTVQAAPAVSYDACGNAMGGGIVDGAVAESSTADSVAELFLVDSLVQLLDLAVAVLLALVAAVAVETVHLSPWLLSFAACSQVAVATSVPSPITCSSDAVE